MKSLEKLKSFFIKQHADGKVSFNIGKIVGLVLIAVSNLSAITLGTLAWFNMSTRDSRVDIVSGDLNVEVKKISAYKYVYPYYKSSTEFIDYDSEGVVKKYVLEDNTLVYNEQDVKDISISADDATIALGTKYGGTGYKTTTIEDANSNMVYIPTANYAPEFRYYLIGDDTFNGVSNSWSLTDGYAFALRESVTNEKHAILDNIVVSQGSSFRLLEVTVSNEQYSYNYYPLNSVTESSAFRIVDDNSDGKGDRLICLRSGIFKITHSPNQLLIELHTKDNGARKDISVISNNSLDPTKVSIDYAGSVDKTDYPTIESYMPSAIYNQNTTMIIDVELAYKNANEIEAGLKVERTAATSNSIFNVAGKYTDTTHNLDGYLDDEHQNMLRASDFYNFYAVFTKTPYADTDAIWEAIHRVADNNSQKYINGETYDTTIECELNLKGNDDSTIIPAVDPTSQVQQTYHCYIAIEYDYEHSAYFLNKNRLGKTYLLDRDFGFYFYGEQRTESQN